MTVALLRTAKCRDSDNMGLAPAPVAPARGDDARQSTDKSVPSYWNSQIRPLCISRANETARTADKSTRDTVQSIWEQLPNHHTVGQQNSACEPLYLLTAARGEAVADKSEDEAFLGRRLERLRVMARVFFGASSALPLSFSLLAAPFSLFAAASSSTRGASSGVPRAVADTGSEEASVVGASETIASASLASVSVCDSIFCSALERALVNAKEGRE